MNPLLFDERVIAVQPSLVRAVGSVTCAAVLQQVHYHAQAGHTEAGGWVVRTNQELGDEIGLSEQQVKRATQRLERSGIIESCQPEGHLRRKRYRILYESAALSDSSKGRNRPMEGPKSTPATAEIDPSSSTKNLRVKDHPTGFTVHQPIRCERGCWSGWLTDEDGTIHRCECAA